MLLLAVSKWLSTRFLEAQHEYCETNLNTGEIRLYTLQNSREACTPFHGGDGH